MSILSGLYDDDFIMELERLYKMEKVVIYDLVKKIDYGIVLREKLNAKLKSIQIENNYTDDDMAENICCETVY